MYTAAQQSSFGEISGQPHHGYSEQIGRSSWAGLSIGDAFNFNLDPSIRLQAHRKLHEMIRKAQRAVSRQAGLTTTSGSSFRIEPQFDPCYTAYPSALSVYAAIGLTAFLEFESLEGDAIYTACVKSCLEDMAKGEENRSETALYRQLAEMTARTIQRRLIMQELSRNPELESVELYRLFSVSRQPLRLQSLADILNATILYGDVLPEWKDDELHPAARELIGEVRDISHSFMTRLSGAASCEYLKIGTEWVSTLCRRLAVILMKPPHSHPEPGEKENSSSESPPETPNPFSREVGNSQGRSILPLNALLSPKISHRYKLEDSLVERLSIAVTDQEKKLMALKYYLTGASPIHQFRKAVSALSSSIGEAIRQAQDCKGMRSDLLEQKLQSTSFEKGPIQDAPSDGHVVELSLDGNSLLQKTIHDRPIIPSDSRGRYEALIDEAGETIEALRGMLYPNSTEIPRAELLKTNGAINPARLPLNSISEAIFRRFRIHKPAVPEGASTLVIACDGSGSLNSLQMKMVKILSTAWLVSASGYPMHVLAGIYHSDTIRTGVKAPMIRWIWHPRKTPALSYSDAVRCIAALPDSGTGIQSDALSLAFITDEARRISKNNMIYLIHITDCKWNRSFKESEGGFEEIRSLYKNLLRNNGRKIHTTLIALGINRKIGLEDVLHKVIAVPNDRLRDYCAVAKEIALYAASCIMERRASLD
jgi:hypothetical protein